MNCKIKFATFIALSCVLSIGFQGQGLAQSQSPCYVANGSLFSGSPITDSGVYLFAKSSFAGCGYRFTGDVSSLTNTPVGNDTVSSVIIIGDYAATLFQNGNFGGNASTFIKSQSSIKGSLVGEDRASSLRIHKGDCNDEPGVYLYEDSNFGGRCTKFKEDAQNLRIHYIQPNVGSSIKIIGDWVATVYAEENFGGTASRFEANDANFGDNVIGHDHARSIQVTPQQRVCDGGPGVYLYATKNYLGTCSRFTSSVGDLSVHRIGDNAASSIRVTGGYQATLYADGGAGGSNTTFTANDPDLSNDRVGDDRASSIRVTGPNPEQSTIYRMQIRIETGDVSDAGTNDDVLVSLNQNNFTWLDYGRNDFERGDKFTYDLLLDGVGQVSDIKWITVNKSGSDGWCLKSFELWINNQSPPDIPNPDRPVVIYRKEFPSCRWLDNKGNDNRSLVIPFGEMRAQTAWRQSQVPGLRTFMHSSEVSSRIESAVGHALHYIDRAFWGESHGKSVEIEGFDIVPVNTNDHRSDRIHVDLDLAGDASITDVEADVDFDLLINCTQPEGSTAQISIKTANVNAHVNWLADWFSGAESKIEHAFPTIKKSLDTGLAVCPGITVLKDGSIRIP